VASGGVLLFGYHFLYYFVGLLGFPLPSPSPPFCYSYGFCCIMKLGFPWRLRSIIKSSLGFCVWRVELTHWLHLFYPHSSSLFKRGFIAMVVFAYLLVAQGGVDILQFSGDV
jgi:hypothetical protein